MPPWRHRIEAWAFAAAALTALGIGLAPTWVDDDTLATATVHALAGYLWVPAAGLSVWALISRTPARIALAAGLLAGPLTRTLPGVGFSTPAVGPTALRLVTANVLMVHPSPDALLDELVALDADVYLLQEVSPRWADAIDARRALDGHRFRRVLAQEDSFGIAILSRIPMTITDVDLDGVTMLEAMLSLEGRPLRLYAVHTLPPRTDAYTPVWHDQMAQLAQLVAQDPSPVVIGGDLNATRYHPSFRRLLASGLRDAHAEVGRAAASTWPNGVFPLPPMRVDHVLVGDGVAVRSVREGRSVGSDHNPVGVELAWGP